MGTIVLDGYKWKQHRVFRYCPWEKCLSWQTRINRDEWKCDCGHTIAPLILGPCSMSSGLSNPDDTGESIETA